MVNSISINFNSLQVITCKGKKHGTYHPGFFKCYGRKSWFVVGNTERLVTVFLVPVSGVRGRPRSGAAN